MTITIRRSTAVILIALIGVLGGLAIGHVTEAFSSETVATASLSSEATLLEIATELKVIRRGLVGGQVQYQAVATALNSVLRQLEK